MKKYYDKIVHYFFLCLGLFPFALSLCFARAGATFGTIANDVFATFNFLPLSSLMHDVLTNMGVSSVSSTACNAFSWIFFVFFAFLIYHIISFLPMLCMSAFERKGDNK